MAIVDNAVNNERQAFLVAISDGTNRDLFLDSIMGQVKVDAVRHKDIGRGEIVRSGCTTTVKFKYGDTFTGEFATDGSLQKFSWEDGKNAETKHYLRRPDGKWRCQGTANEDSVQGKDADIQMDQKTGLGTLNGVSFANIRDTRIQVSKLAHEVMSDKNKQQVVTDFTQWVDTLKNSDLNQDQQPLEKLFIYSLLESKANPGKAKELAETLLTLSGGIDALGPVQLAAIQDLERAHMRGIDINNSRIMAIFNEMRGVYCK